VKTAANYLINGLADVAPIIWAAIICWALGGMKKNDG
jgi:hypothetical protein